MDDLKVVSADDHIAETPDLWQTRLPKRLRDAGPRMIELPDKSGHAFVLPGLPMPRPLSVDVVAGRKYEEYKGSGIRWEEIRPGCYDPVERLKDMDIGGVHAAVLYP